MSIVMWHISAEHALAISVSLSFRGSLMEGNPRAEGAIWNQALVLWLVTLREPILFHVEQFVKVLGMDQFKKKLIIGMLSWICKFSKQVVTFILVLTLKSVGVEQNVLADLTDGLLC